MLPFDAYIPVILMLHLFFVIYEIYTIVCSCALVFVLSGPIVSTEGVGGYRKGLFSHVFPSAKVVGLRTCGAVMTARAIPLRCGYTTVR